MFPSGGIEGEKLTTLWYHDHRLDFTAANVYAGLSGFFLYFDERDTGDENDPEPAWGLPSGLYDVPLIFHDVQFHDDGQAAFNNFYTDGWLGDQVTINRTIRPYFKVQRRKYRFRILNGGPSRFYQFALSRDNPDRPDPMLVITGDGNFLPEPVAANQLLMSVAQRCDVIIDFSRYKAGDRVILWNMLEQTNGKGPSGRLLSEPDGVLAFDVEGRRPAGQQPACRTISGICRWIPLPDEIKKQQNLPLDLRPPGAEPEKPLTQRTWDFDYDGGLWTINGLVMDPNRIDAGVVQGNWEIWTFRNTGNDWSHPVHCHFTEFLILEVNGRPYDLKSFIVHDREKGEHIFFNAEIGGEHGDVVQVRINKKGKYAFSDPGTGRKAEGQILKGGKYTYLNPRTGEKHQEQVPPHVETGEGSFIFIDTETSRILRVADVFLGGPRRDVATILPGDEMKVAIRFMDFVGRHVLHCHNVVHEDHAMMIRWDILDLQDRATHKAVAVLKEEGKKKNVKIVDANWAIVKSVEANDVWKDGFFGASSPDSTDQVPYSFDHVENHPPTSTYIEPARGKSNFPPQAPKEKDSD